MKVEYSTFGTNEDMYNQLTIGDTYDLICPSEYMTMKLMAENKILKYSDEFWDTSDANNYYAKGVSPYIKKSLDQLKYQGQSVGDYTAGYMWGTLGYVYNPKYVSREDAEDWGLLLNQKYCQGLLFCSSWYADAKRDFNKEISKPVKLQRKIIILVK